MHCSRYSRLAILSLLLFGQSIAPGFSTPAPVNLAQTTETRSTEADRLLQQGVEQYQSQQFSAADQSFQQALKQYQARQDRSGEWFATYFLGLLHGSLRDFAKGSQYLERSLVLAQELGDRQKQGDALTSLGNLREQAGETAKAAEFYQQSLKLVRDLGDQGKQQRILESLVRVYGVLGDTTQARNAQQQLATLSNSPSAAVDDVQKALQILREAQQLATEGTKISLPQAAQKYEEALALARQTKNQTVEAIALLGLGGVYADLGDKRRAITYGEQVIKLTQGNPALAQVEATALVSLARYQADLGEGQKALTIYQQALTRVRASGDRAGEATILNNMGRVYLDQGEFRQALALFNQSLQLAQTAQDPSGQARSLNNIGLVYDRLGQYQQALQTYDRALQLFQTLKEPFRSAVALNNIGSVYAYLGQRKKALEYYDQALKILETIGDPAGQATTLANIGTLHSFDDNHSQALAAFQQALTMAQKVGDRRLESAILGNMGQVYADQGQYSQALTTYQQALTLARTLNSRSEEAGILVRMGQVYYSQKQPDRALETLQTALPRIQELGDRRLEFIALSAIGRVHLAAAQLTAATQRFQESAAVIEQVRSNLGSNDLDKVYFLEEQASVYRLWQTALLAQKQPEAALEVSERGRARAFVELLARRLDTGRNPVNQAATPPITLSAIQQVARDHQATIVEYAILKDDLKLQKREATATQLLIWVVRPTGEVTMRQVDLQGVLQGVALESLVAGSRESIGAGNRGFSFNENRELVARATSQSQTRNQEFQKLHQLLIQPIADLLPTHPTDRIIFVPQGPLFLVPFAALQDATGKYLIEKHTILTAPAIQVLQLTRQQRHRVTKRPEGVLVVGNPQMPSLPTTVGGEPQPLPALPGAEQEARTIASLFKTNAVLGKQATKAFVVKQMENARLIHLATHGLLDDYRGLGIPGAIALAPSEQEDGLLTASEILNLNLRADLVVLSACDTGRGEITGDGVIGLSRSLISAGVPSVIVSLWKVPDASTAQLMTQFYQNLQQNPDRAQALRQAMLTTMKQYPDPRDWAAFVLIGEAN
ncbi:MAG: CHAT domain-containing protein [Leptolyngbyaceae cyanobacterium bins.59]|nr:CHAT domain-containing protein [Leptolyngbyaceae cyanobacterium bins.59]